jgi:ribosome biogenesis GTPase A
MVHGKKAKMRKMERRAAPKERQLLKLMTPSADEDKSHREQARARTEKPEISRMTAIDGMLMGILGFNPNKMAGAKAFKKMESIFAKEARFEVDARVVLARNALANREPAPVAWFVQHLDHPIRPVWDKTMTREILEERETDHFNGWLARIYSAHEPRDLNYFEHNLEVWRQLWRVLEKSEVIVIVTDARNPLVHTPLPLVRQAQKMGKRVVILLNKVDLLSREQIKAWMIFLMSYIPGCKVVPFSAHPDRVKKGERKVQGRRNQELPDPTTDPAVLALMKVCGVELRKDLGKKEDDLTAEQVAEQRRVAEEKEEQKQLRRWAEDEKVEMEEFVEKEAEIEEERMHRKKKWDESRGLSGAEKKAEKKVDATERRKAAAAAAALKGVVIGVVGQPSVGKTSVLNRVVGRIVGSEARTAGHTKYFQTIPLTHLGEATIVDCPGLLFPARNEGAVRMQGQNKVGGVPRCLQEAFGMFDTAQVRIVACIYLGGGQGEQRGCEMMITKLDFCSFETSVYETTSIRSEHTQLAWQSSARGRVE